MGRVFQTEARNSPEEVEAEKQRERSAFYSFLLLFNYKSFFVVYIFKKKTLFYQVFNNITFASFHDILRGVRFLCLRIFLKNTYSESGFVCRMTS